VSEMATRPSQPYRVRQGVFLPISAAARAELVPLALVVVVRVPTCKVEQAPERLHFRSMAHAPLKFVTKVP
jgi:hypothetical protein